MSPDPRAGRRVVPAPLRLGIVGCGRVVERFHLPALSRVREVEAVALSDPDPEALAIALARLPQALAFGSFTELLAGPPLEAVLVASPPATHADLCIRALESGLHVLVEKPMALDSADGRRMAAAARSSGRHLQVGFNRRFREAYLRLREALVLESASSVRAGAGVPAGVGASPSADVPAGAGLSVGAGVRGAPGIRAVRFDLVFPGTRWGARSGFMGLDASGGGVLDDVFSHQVDVLTWVLGAAPSAVRLEQGHVRPRLPVNGPTAPSGPIDGALLRIELAFPGELMASCTAAHGTYVERLEIQLEDGRVWLASGARASVASGRALGLRRRGAWLADRLALVHARLGRRPSPTLRSFERQLRDFAAAARGGGGGRGAGPIDGIRAIAASEGCRVSARTGGAWVQLS